MSVLEFFVEGEPRPQPRPRFDPRTGRTYKGEHKSTRSVEGWRHAVALRGLEAMRRRGLQPFSRPVWLELTFAMPRPRAHHVASNPARPLRPDAPRWHTKKPDRSNLEKAVEDALNGVLWIDDSQVVSGPVHKVYADAPAEVGVTVRIRDAESADVRGASTAHE